MHVSQRVQMRLDEWEIVDPQWHVAAAGTMLPGVNEAVVVAAVCRELHELNQDRGGRAAARSIVVPASWAMLRGVGA